MNLNELKYHATCFRCTDLKANPYIIVGFTSERVWLKQDNNLLILTTEDVKEYNRIYDDRRRN